MAGPTNTRNNNTQPPFNIRPVNNGLTITPPAQLTFSQVTETPLTLTTPVQESGGGPNGLPQFQSDAVRQQSVNIYTEVQPGSSAPITPLSIPANVTGRTNVMEAMEGVSRQPPRAPNSSVGLTPNPIRILTANDLGEDTYGLPQDVVNAGSEPVAALPSSMRPDIVACTKINTSYALGGAKAADKTASLLSYMDDVYKLSLAQDTLRRTIIANKLASESSQGLNMLQTALESVGDSVAADLGKTQTTINNLQSLVAKTIRIRDVCNIKQLLGSDPRNPNLVFRAPLTDLRDFAITRMLYSPESYKQTSDTKLLYQLVSDASNVLKKCSFNLVEGFSDYDRASTAASGAFTVDAETYGNNAFSYAPALITAKYFVNTSADDQPNTTGNRAHTAFIESLPVDTASRAKFLCWFISKEMRVSKGLGKYLPADAAQVFGGIANVGNPFDNIFGAAPSDIYSIPAGASTLAGLFNVATNNGPGSSTDRSQRILPFENSNIDLVSYARTSNGINNIISGESVFVDQHLSGAPVLFRNYRTLYTTRIQAARTIIDRLLLAQQASDPTSDILTASGFLGILRVRFTELIRGLTDLRTMSPVNAVLQHMMLISQKDAALRFELYKLLCLCYLYGTSEGDNTRLRSILFQELSSAPLSGGDVLTVDNLAALTAEQLGRVLRLYQDTLQQPLNLQRPGFALQYDAGSTTLAQTNFTDASVQNILYAAQPSADPNVFASIVSVAKELFAACSSTDGLQYQLVPNSSLTRFTGLSASGMFLVLFETYSALITEFLGAGTVNTSADDLIQVSRGLDGLSYAVGVNPAMLQQLAAGGVAGRFTDIENAMLNEEYFVANVIAFLQQIASGLETVADPSASELETLSFVNGLGSANAKMTFASIRSAMNNHRIVSTKLTKNNPNNQRLLNFYIDADNPDMSPVDYAKLRDFSGNKLLTTSSGDLVRTILSVGVPRGMLGTASDTRKDLVMIRVHRLNSRQEDIVYQPREFVFDMSLFPVGFQTNNDEFVSCADISENALNTVRTTSDLVRIDPYYTNKQQIAREALRNVTNSYLLRSYINMMTGINVDDSGVRDINASLNTIRAGFETLSNDGLALAQTVLKGIQPRTYEGFLDVFQSFYGDATAQNLLLPLTRNILDFVFSSRLYDRIFNIAVAPSDFVVARGQSANISSLSLRNNSAGVLIDQYFVEVVTR